MGRGGVGKRLTKVDSTLGWESGFRWSWGQQMKKIRDVKNIRKHWKVS